MCLFIELRRHVNHNKNPIDLRGQELKGQGHNGHLTCEHNKDQIVVCIFIKLSIESHFNYFEGMNVIEFGCQGHCGHIRK